ncbi:MAG: hypothetical protein KatS3mg038_3282 [Candidatus Kapaibacterium sp.]|nr:MAG: hypothetical protein KatS3mg038_3060 [Candidatus Kapabacteria bacterium]GIV52761.1 MAG: hypothetical protein KatS3mg038_3282 [Candidatus Kapabacteria bacterium]
MGSYKNRLYPRMTERPLRFRLNPYSPLYYGLALAFLGEGAQEGCTHAIDSGPYQVPTRHYEGQPATLVYDSHLRRPVLSVVSENRRTIRLAYDVILTYPWSAAVWAHQHAVDKITGFGGTGGIGRTYVWITDSSKVYVAGTLGASTFGGPGSLVNVWLHGAFSVLNGLVSGWINGKYMGTNAHTIGDLPIRYIHGREDAFSTNTGYLADLLAWNNRILTTNEAAALADPGNVDLRVGGVPLILPPRRRSWPGITITTQDEVITLPTLLAEC